MWQPEFLWFFTIFHHEFRKNNPIAFEVRMVLAVAHVFGCYNPKQLADCLEVPPQQFSTELQDWSVYQVKKMLRRFLVKQAAEKRKPVMSQSATTRSRPLANAASRTLVVPTKLTAWKTVGSTTLSRQLRWYMARSWGRISFSSRTLFA